MTTEAAIQYILDNNNVDILSDEELEDLIFEVCDLLDSANEELEFGTYGEHFENDIDRDKVSEYFMNRRKRENGSINSKC